MFAWLNKKIYEEIKSIVPVFTQPIKNDVESLMRRVQSLEDRIITISNETKIIKNEMAKTEESVQLLEKYKNHLIKESEALRVTIDNCQLPLPKGRSL